MYSWYVLRNKDSLGLLQRTMYASSSVNALFLPFASPAIDAACAAIFFCLLSPSGFCAHKTYNLGMRAQNVQP